MMLRIIGASAEMPLADVPCCIAHFLQTGSQAFFFQGQVIYIRCLDETPVARMCAGGEGNEIGDANSCGILTGKDARARRRADRACGVGIREPHSRGCQSVNVGRLVERAAVASQVAPFHVVDEDEDDVGHRCDHGDSTDDIC